MYINNGQAKHVIIISIKYNTIMLFLFCDVLQEYINCDCAYHLFTINVLKHLNIVVCKWYLEWMTSQLNANLTKETAYYLRICFSHILSDL
jgi:hypothetical protein